MTPYQNYSRYYDQIEGNKSDYINFLHKSILRFNPNAKTLLELGCGTGYVMFGLWKKGLKVEGLDISADMLNQAKAKKFSAKYYNQSIADYNTGKKYDVIIAVYDTFNHVLNFKDWVSGFKQVKKHLKPGGVFLFDINTLDRLNKISIKDPYTLYFGDNLFTIRVTNVKNNIFTWEINIFEKQSENNFKLYKDVIKELGVETEQVVKELKKHFKDVKMFDGEDFILKPNAERIYFACRN